jgi:hypothetical protein
MQTGARARRAPRQRNKPTPRYHNSPVAGRGREGNEKSAANAEEEAADVQPRT